MPVITLLTDFGLADEYVGVMKGVILTVNPEASIVDVTHGIGAQDIVQAAYTLKSSYTYFPARTVHVAVVDPGVGSSRDIIALRMNDHVFLAPDNGLLSPLMEDGGSDELVRLTDRRFFLNTVSSTFHGRDILAPAAAHISLGVPLSELGPPANRDKLVRLSVRKPTRPGPGQWTGSIITVDRFGNLITNIEGADLASPGNKAEIRLGDHLIRGVSTTYADAKPYHPLALIGSRGYLEIAVNQGDAAANFRAGRGDAVRVIVQKRGNER